jgi:hypothetical protein
VCSLYRGHVSARTVVAVSLKLEARVSLCQCCVVSGPLPSERLLAAVSAELSIADTITSLSDWRAGRFIR